MKKIILIGLMLFSTFSFGKYEKEFGVKKDKLGNTIRYSVNGRNFYAIHKGDIIDRLIKVLGEEGAVIDNITNKGGNKFILGHDVSVFTSFYSKRDDTTITIATNGDENFLSFLLANEFISNDQLIDFREMVGVLGYDGK